MNQILTDEEITLIVRECARGSSINRDGSTSHRIARAIEAAVINKLNSAEPVAWYNPNEDHSDEAFMWDKDTSGDHLIPVFTHPPAPSAIESQAAEIAKYKSLCDQLGEYLNDAATSLETIAMRSYGDDSYINTMHQVRGYASARASVARKDLEAWRAMK